MNRLRGGRQGATLRSALALTVLCLAAVAGAAVPRPAVVTDPAAGACVAPPAEMRRNHMEMLKHQRDRTLREGVRGSRVSLNACIDCHASRGSGRAAGSKDDFCESCHRYAAVKLDCFECHQARAGSRVATGARP